MAAPLPRVFLRLLGPVQIEHNDDLVEKLGSQKSLILLAYLIRHPHEHSRAKLASLLWLDQPQSTGRSNLRWALNNLSKLVPGVINATRQTLQFAPANPIRLDLDEFDEYSSPISTTDNFINSVRLDELTKAVVLYRGDFLEGLAVGDAPDLELWLLQEREYWRRRVVTLLERLIEGYIALKQYYHAERFATQLLMHEPWREETHQQLMWLLTATGQRSAALSQYETCRQILANELAVEPSPATVTLYEQIRDNLLIVEQRTVDDDSVVDPTSVQSFGAVRHRQGRPVAKSTQRSFRFPDLAHFHDAGKGAFASPTSSMSNVVPGTRTHAVPHHLPRERTPLVGRQRELVELHKLLITEERPLVTLIGEGGVGKSRLALAVADLLVKGNQELGIAASLRFLHGIWFVPLVGIDAPQAIESSLITAIAAAVHLQFGGTQSPFQQLADFLRRKEMLLLLDNMEHLVEGALILSDILAEAPGVHMLVTSRVPLDLQEEWRYAIQGMALPEPITGTVDQNALSSLQMNSSVALFIQTGQRVDHTFALTAENQRSVVAICRHLHGLPLALELAATGLAQMSSQALADALIQSANQSSERDSTAKVVSTKGENPLDLLQTSMRNMPVRHRAMRNVFAYSWQLLSDSEQQAAMQFALFRGGADRGALVAITCKAQSTLTELVHKSLVQRDGDGRFAMHELLRQFCLEQLDRSADPTLVTNTRQRHATYYLQSLHESELTIRGHDPQPLLTQLQRDLDNLRQAWQWALHNGYWSLIDQSLSGLSRFYLLLGLLSEARHTMREAAGVLSTVPVEQRMIAQEGISPEQLLARLLVTDAFFSNALADYDAAVTVAQEVIAAPTSSHDGMISATAHLRWGEALWYKGEIETAQPHLTQALALVEDHISSGQQWQPEIKADALCVLGLIAVRKGDYSAATVAYGESHRLSESLGDAYRSGRALYSLGTVYRNQAHYAEARRYLALGLTIARQTGDRHSESRVLNSLGDIELYQGNFRKAREYYLHVADFAAVVGDRRSECIAQTNLGIVARDLGQYGIAIENFNESLTLARTIGFPRGEGWTLCCLSLLHHQQGRHREALRFAREALVLFDHLGDRLGQAFAQTNLGRAYQGMHSWQDAQQAYEAAKTHRDALGQPHLAIEVTAGLAVAAWGYGDQAKALAYVEEILDYLHGATLEGSEVPSTIYTTCYQILHALEDARSSQVWAEAQHFYQSRAAQLDGDEQIAYLDAIHQLTIALHD